MNNALALIPTQNEFESMMRQADVMVKSGFLPQSIKNANQAVTIMMVGRELNIPPWQALNGINVIQGRPTVAPQLMLALIYRTGLSEDITVSGDDKAYTVTMKRKGQSPHTEVFTMKDAEKLGLSGKDNWRKQPATMLKWRAVAACARIVYPDVTMGLYTTEEIAPDNVSLSEDGSLQYTPDAPIVMVERTTPPANIIDISGTSALKPVDVQTGEIIDEKPLPSQTTDRIIRDQPEPVKAEAEQPTATWDTPNILDLLLKKCNRELAGYVPELQPSDIMRLIGRPDKDFKVLAYWVEWYPTPKAAFEAIEDAVKFEALAN